MNVLCMSGRLDSNQRPPEPHFGEPVRVFAEKPVDSPPCVIIRIAQIPKRARFPHSLLQVAATCEMRGGGAVCPRTPRLAVGPTRRGGRGVDLPRARSILLQ